MADYPAHWEADVVLSDGGTCHLRPIRPDDAERLVEMFGRLSAETIYRRFFIARSQLSPREVERFTHVDHADRVALIATLAGEMVAVGRYDRLPGTDEAEVAFVVEDAQQGRGIGSVLLEHLAAAARERGLRQFVAEVLPGNRPMVGVFTDAGYRAHREYGDGVVRLTFPIEPTELSQSVMQAREHRAEARSIERLLKPRSVAVVGASRASPSIGQQLLRNLVEFGFRGDVYAVNPAADEIAGVKAYRSVVDIPGPLDLVVVATPADQLDAVVSDCAAKGVLGLVVVSAGFAEAGPEGAAAQRRLVRTAREAGMRVVGPNCLGVINSDDDVRLNATLAPVTPRRGRVGFFCHAGALGVAILEQVARRGGGLSTFVSAGNRADVSGNDLLQYWEDDPATDVVLLYLESFGNPHKFGRIARRLARRKPVVAVKSGRSLAGPPAWLAATGVRMPESAVEALFEQAGVIRVDTLAQMFDVAALVAHQPLPRGDRVAVVGNSAALGVLAADACAAAGLHVTHEADIGAAGSADDFRAALAAALGDDGVDAVVTVFIPPLYTPNAEVARVLVEAGSHDKPVVTTFYGFEGLPEILRSEAPGDGEGSVPSYRSPEAAVQALARAVSYAQWRGRPAGAVPDFDVDADAARLVVEQALAEAGGEGDTDSGWLDREAAARLVAAYGIEVLPSASAGSLGEAVAAAGRLGYPVVVKAALPHLRHRPDLGTVHLDLADADGVALAYTAVASLGSSQVVVQPMARPGVPVVVGLSEDPSFGPIVSFGLGGIARELLGDVGYRSLPLTDVGAASLVRSVRAAPLLFGYRGAEPVDVAAVEDVLLRVAALADDVADVAELELNPVLVSTRGVTVVDARVRVARAPGPLDAGPRRLR